MTARDLIELSQLEQRTVTAYPSSQEEYDTLLDTLLAEGEGDTDTAEHVESGMTEVWSDTWRVDIVHPR